MRVTPEQIAIVKALAHRHFGVDADIWLFGSRVDDEKKGGDYDFLIETSLDDAGAVVESKITFLTELQGNREFEDEKIDVIIKRRHAAFEMPVYAAARREGVRL